MSYLDRYDATPDADKFKVARTWLDNPTDALGFCNEMREKRPIIKTDVCTFVADMNDVIEVLRVFDVFTVEPYKAKMSPYLMSEDDTAKHFRDKSLMSAFLDRNDLNGASPNSVRKQIGNATKAALDAAKGQIDVVYQLTRGIPLSLVDSYMGLKNAPDGALRRWSYWNQYDAFHNHPWDIMSDDMRKTVSTNVAQAKSEMKDYLGKLIQDKMTERLKGLIPGVKLSMPADTIVDRVLNAAFEDTSFHMGTFQDLNPKDAILKSNVIPTSSINTAEMLALCQATQSPPPFGPLWMGLNFGGLLIGTVETTSQLTAQALAVLLRGDPQILKSAQIAATYDDPATFDGYVWEAARFWPLSPYLFRLCEGDYTLGAGRPWQTTIAKGTAVLPLVQAAMNDPVRFPNPDKFDPTRPWRQNTFHFGYGLHECMGRYVGEMLVPEIIRQILLRTDIKVVSDIDFDHTPFPAKYVISYK